MGRQLSPAEENVAKSLGEGRARLYRRCVELIDLTKENQDWSEFCVGRPGTWIEWSLSDFYAALIHLGDPTYSDLADKVPVWVKEALDI